MEKILKVGIVGCGGIANQKHLPALSELKEVEIVAFCDIIEDRAIKSAKKFGTEDAKVYTDYKELLKDKSIDVIHVLTPNKSHCVITVDSLESGKHVMCEKPMAKSYEEAKLMIEASKKSGKKLTIGYQNRFRQDSLYVKDLCKRGDLGDIYMAKAHAVRRRAVPTWGVFLNEEEQGGGPLIDIGTHALDLTLWLMDNYKPKSVVGNVYKKLNDNGACGNIFGSWNPEEYTVEDSAFALITMENGATIFLESSWALNTIDVHEAKTTLCGTKAGVDMKNGLVINGDDNNQLYDKEIKLNSDAVDYFNGGSFKPEVLEAKSFINAILNEEDTLVKPEEAIVVTRILEAIYESAKTGTIVNFD